MTYQAFYREWRPQTFGDVVGQRHVTTTLKNALAAGRVAHAYLFAGPRGTGKTSVAKILAKAVNCERGPAPEPCNECSLCREITQGSSLDVMEIDAASNRGIDEIRDLRQKIHFAPAAARRKVYIIDEVHMLTTEAFNALLKTLEEPPPYALFVLATTEPHKIPPTIASRCQRFDFHRLSVADMAGRLAKVAETAGVRVGPEAIELIARKGEGSLRDSLGLLDQCVSFAGQDVGVEHVLAISGDVREDVLFDLADALAAGDIPVLLKELQELAFGGVDMRQLTRELIGHFRNLLVAAVAGQPAALVTTSSSALPRLVEQATRFGRERAMDILTTLSQAEADMRSASQPRLVLELALLQALATGATPRAAAPSLQTRPSTAAKTVPARPKAAPTPRAAQVQETLPTMLPLQPRGDVSAPAEPEIAGPAPAATPRAAEQTMQAAQETAAGAPASGPAPVALTLDGVKRAWPNIMQFVKRGNRSTHALLLEAGATAVEGACLVLQFKYDFHREKAEEPNNKELILRAVREHLGRQVEVRCTLRPSSGRPARRPGRQAAGGSLFDGEPADLSEPSDLSEPPAPGPEDPGPGEPEEEPHASGGGGGDGPGTRSGADGRPGGASEPQGGSGGETIAIDLFGGTLVEESDGPDFDAKGLGNDDDQGGSDGRGQGGGGSQGGGDNGGAGTDSAGAGGGDA